MSYSRQATSPVGGRERREREGEQDEKYEEELCGNSRSYHEEKLVEASRPIRMQVFQQTVAIPCTT